MIQTPRFSPQAGIAIGPILFILAILAIIAAYMASGNSDYQVASGTDRINADVTAQANLIRNAINQCNMQYSLAVSTGSVSPSTDAYPTSTGSGTAVKSLTCAPMGGSSLWGATLLPPPTSGFNDWMYIDDAAAGGGRCFWTTPSSANPMSNSGIVTGLTHAAAKFNSATAYSATNEVIYNPAKASQKFTVWITMPTGTPNANCLP
ncbi:MAG: hypothetical protein P4M15_14955 [Alphaproteobacteria bacterium]|nr:hypothetical protein [Alphaproteobacteria bacterium]